MLLLALSPNHSLNQSINQSFNQSSKLCYFIIISDIAVGLFFILLETLFSWFEVEWNKYVCSVYYGYFSIDAFYVSTYAIVVMSIDRLYVKLRPVSAISKGNMYRYGLVMSSWILGLLLGIQYAVHIDYDGVHCRHAIPYKQVSRIMMNYNSAFVSASNVVA